MSALPLPLVPPGVDLRHFASMRLDVVRLRDSRFTATVTGEEFRCALLLWCAAWHQVPAASLPDDDVELSALAGFGRAVASWREHKAGALHGWIKCSDGRLYHPVVAEKALEAWNQTIEHRWKRESDRIRKENKSRAERGLAPLEMPTKPQEIQVGTPLQGGPKGNTGEHEARDADPKPSGSLDLGTGRADLAPTQPVPTETSDVSNGNPAENALKGSDRKGIDLSCPKPASPVRTRKRHPEDFERWWSAYPTDPLMSKSEAAKAWAKLSDEDRVAAMAAVPGFVAHCRAKPDYRPLHAVRFLTQRRFEGYVATVAPGGHLSLIDEPRVDFGNGVSAPERLVLDVLRRGEWLDGWGPRIGRSGCRLPQRILDAVTAAA